MRRIEISDAELEILSALEARAGHQFTIGGWLMQKLYDAGFVHDLAVQAVRTERKDNITVLIVEQ